MAGADMPSLIDQLSAKAAECRELLGDLRSAQRSLREDVRAAEEARKKLNVAVSEMVEADPSAEVRRQLEKLGKTTREAMDKSVAKVQDEFERLTNIMMTGDPQGRSGGFDLRNVRKVPESLGPGATRKRKP